MRFVRMSVLRDFDQTQQTIGLDALGQVWLMTGQTDRSESGHANAQFSPRDALQYANAITRAALEGIRIQEHYVTLSGYEQFPLRTEWGYNRYNALADYVGVKAAMAQASREETGTYACAQCGANVRLNESGLWVAPMRTTCEHAPDIPLPGDASESGDADENV